MSPERFWFTKVEVALQNLSNLLLVLDPPHTCPCYAVALAVVVTAADTKYYYDYFCCYCCVYLKNQVYHSFDPFFFTLHTAHSKL